MELGDAGLESIRVRINEGTDEASVLDEIPRILERGGGTIVNTSSPLRLDAPMIEGVIEMARHRQVVVPELNRGQLSRLLRAEFLVDVRSITKVRGVPFTAGELEQAALEILEGAR